MKKCKILIVLLLGLMLAVSMVLAACGMDCPGDGNCIRRPNLNSNKHCGSNNCRAVTSTYVSCDC